MSSQDNNNPRNQAPVRRSTTTDNTQANKPKHAPIRRLRTSSNNRRPAEDLLIGTGESTPDLSIRQIIAERCSAANAELSAEANGVAVDQEQLDQAQKEHEKKMREEFSNSLTKKNAPTDEEFKQRELEYRQETTLTPPTRLYQTVTEGDDPPPPKKAPVLNVAQRQQEQKEEEQADSKPAAIAQDPRDYSLRSIVVRRSQEAQGELAAAELNILENFGNNFTDSRATKEGVNIARDTEKAAAVVLNDKQLSNMNLAGNTPAAAPNIEYDSSGQPLKSSLPPGVQRPGAYAGAPGAGYGRVASARYHVLGNAAPSNRSMESSASDRMVTADVPAPRLSTTREARVEDSERLDALEAPCEVAPPSSHLGEQEDDKEFLIAQYKTILTVMGVCLLVLIVLAIAVPVSLLKGSKDDNKNFVLEDPEASLPPIPNVDPTKLPGLPDATWVAMFDTNSPQFQAYSWILLDPNLDEYDQWHLHQRFALATFYYAMNGKRWDSTSWLDYDTNECEWIADPKTCNEEGEVILLNVTSQRGFKGELPTELNLLTKLEGLDFSNNAIGGNLTTLFGRRFQHPSLQNLWCSNCRLEGIFPVELARMVNLRGLVLNDNEISGTIPPEIRQVSLIAWQMLNNELTGTIPSTIGTMKLLKNLELGGNQLESIPTEIGLVSSLQLLDLAENAIAQKIPSEIGLLNELGSLDLSKNSLVGSIPTNIGLLASANQLNLGNNALTGTIPEQLTQLTLLYACSLDNNKLSGTIPPSFGNMTVMQRLFLRNNELTGPIPSELGSLTHLDTLLLSRNELTGTIPPEVSQLPLLRDFDVEYNPGILCQTDECFRCAHFC